MHATRFVAEIILLGYRALTMFVPSFVKKVIHETNNLCNEACCGGQAPRFGTTKKKKKMNPAVKQTTSTMKLAGEVELCTFEAYEFAILGLSIIQHPRIETSSNLPTSYQRMYHSHTVYSFPDTHGDMRQVDSQLCSDHHMNCWEIAAGKMTLS